MFGPWAVLRPTSLVYDFDNLADGNAFESFFVSINACHAIRAWTLRPLTRSATVFLLLGFGSIGHP